MRRLLLILCLWPWAALGALPETNGVDAPASVNSVADGTVSGVAGGGAPACADSSCTGFLVCQNFEGTGYDNSESWSETIGTNGLVDEDEGTVVLRGSQSLEIYAGDAGQNSRTAFTIDSQTSKYVHFMFRTAALPSTGTTYIFRITSSGDSGRFILELRTDGNIRIHHGTAYVTTTTTPIEINTTYHIWAEWELGTGTDGAYRLYVGTTPTKPAALVTGSDGTVTAASTQQLVQARTYNEITSYFDQLLVHTSSAIGDVCE